MCRVYNSCLGWPLTARGPDGHIMVEPCMSEVLTVETRHSWRLAFVTPFISCLMVLFNLFGVRAQHVVIPPFSGDEFVQFTVPLKQQLSEYVSWNNTTRPLVDPPKGQDFGDELGW